MMQPKNESLKPNWVFTLGRALIRPYLKLKYRPVITGLENIPNSGPALIVSNHLAGLDTVLIPSFTPRKVQFLAKEALFATPFRKWFFNSIGAVGVRRQASSAAQAALETSKEILEAGGVFAIFPEGSRSTTGLLHKGRAGAAWLVLETGATVIPVGLKATDLKKDSSGKRDRIEMHFGQALDFNDLKDLAPGAARKETTERIMQAIANLSGQERSPDYAAGGRDI